MKKKIILIFVSIFVLGFLAGDFESKEFKKKVKNFKIRFLSKQNVDLNQKENLDKKKIKANSYDLDVKELDGLAIMSDTDNSKKKSIAYYQNIYFSSE